MKIGDEALALVKSFSSYKVVPVIITGVMDSAKSVSVNGESEKEIKRYYQTDMSNEMIPSENIFSMDEKDKAIEKRNELMGIKSPKLIEDEKLSKAKNTLNELKKEGKWSTVEEIEDTLTQLIKDGKLSVKSERKQLVDRLNDLYYDPFELMERRLARLF